MEYGGAFGTGEQTVQVRVQVIDMKPQVLDLRVPTYLPAQDLSQRIARDAGLNAHWENGQRRLYWLRARGRLLMEKETLGELGVIDGELVYLLPEPPPGSGVLEQDPDYPENRGYSASGIPNLLLTVTLLLLWAVGWGGALTMSRGAWTVVLPGLALGLLCCNFARHAWGGQGNRLRVAATAFALFLMVITLTPISALAIDILDDRLALEQALPYTQAFVGDLVPGLLTGMVGVFVGWLAWWGAVEPLPEKAEQPAAQQAQRPAAQAACGICNAGVNPDVRMDCPYQCGRAFHVGCYKARESVYRGDRRFCHVCNARVA